MRTPTAKLALAALSSSALFASAALVPRQTSSSYSSSAYSSSTSGAASTSTASGAAPFATFVNKNGTYPLSNGFPDPNATVIDEIAVEAGGGLPNTSAPGYPGYTGVEDIAVVAFNELHEVAFFTELLQNVTYSVPGYDNFSGNLSREYVVAALTAIVAQEQLHALDANGALSAFGRPAVQPCSYSYNVSTFDEAILTAQTFTDAVIGALGGVQQDFSASGNNTALVGLFAGIIGNEAQQDGFFRLTQNKVPSASPFLPLVPGVFAYNAIVQNFVVPGSCPTNQTFPIPELGTLRAVTYNSSSLGNQTVDFLANGTTSASGANVTAGSSYLVLQSGQNLPVVSNISSVTNGTSANITMFSVPLNFTTRGFSWAAITSSPGPFMNGSEVANAATFGPALIEIL